MGDRPLPPCGIYRTRAAVGDVPAGTFVYFHNHGDPGPGVYLPAAWHHNRAEFEPRGHTLPEPWERSAALLEPLAAEGFYRVMEPFACCEKKCRTFERELLVQLGYDGLANPLLFVPELGPAGMTIPATGAAIAPAELRKLTLLKVAQAAEPSPTPRHAGALH
jgi:hypothetical protein